jgi:excisionase family DNA binding protein
MALLLTLKQAATELAIHSETLRLLIKRGEIRGVLVAGRWKVEPDELLLYIQRKKRKP